MSCLADAPVSNDQKSSIEIALTEAVNNVVEHAYAATKQGQVTVTCSVSEAVVTLSIQDTGPFFDPNAHTVDSAPDLDVGRHDLPEGGFGWLLIRQLADRMTYARKGKENCLTLQFDI